MKKLIIIFVSLVLAGCTQKTITSQTKKKASHKVTVVLVTKREDHNGRTDTFEYNKKGRLTALHYGALANFQLSYKNNDLTKISYQTLMDGENPKIHMMSTNGLLKNLSYKEKGIQYSYHATYTKKKIKRIIYKEDDQTSIITYKYKQDQLIKAVKTSGNHKIVYIYHYDDKHNCDGVTRNGKKDNYALGYDQNGVLTTCRTKIHHYHYTYKMIKVDRTLVPYIALEHFLTYGDQPLMILDE